MAQRSRCGGHVGLQSRQHGGIQPQLDGSGRAEPDVVRRRGPCHSLCRRQQGLAAAQLSHAPADKNAGFYQSISPLPRDGL
jgi:hypothetical protein